MSMSTIPPCPWTPADRCERSLRSKGCLLSSSKCVAAETKGRWGVVVSDLEGSDLEGSDLEGSDLECSDLEGSDLEGSLKHFIYNRHSPN
eukprot:gene21516-biopygen7415